MKAYIYLIKNNINSKVYVGSCKSVSIRRSHHFWALKAGRHHSAHLQRAYDKYGKESFEFSLLEECATEKRAEREIYNINLYNSAHRDFGYNVWEVDENGFKCSKETIQKLQNSTICMAVDLYLTSGEFINSFVSQIECARFLKTGSSVVSQILSKKRKSYKGHVIFKSGETFEYTPSKMQRNMTKFQK